MNFGLVFFTRTLVLRSVYLFFDCSSELGLLNVHWNHLLCFTCPRFGGFGGQSISAMCSRPRFSPVLWTGWGSGVLPSTKMPLFVDGMQKEALLFLLQRLGGVGAGGAEGLPEDGQE